MIPSVLAMSLVAALPSGSSGVSLPLQRMSADALGTREGCVVALDPMNGRILALVNPRVAVGTSYPLGSLAKLVTGMAAVQAGVTDGSQTLTCRGRFEGMRCWHVHGKVRLEEAIARSCSSYFFQVGLGLGGDRLAQAFRSAGFGRSTGSGLGDEVAGSLATPRSREQVMQLAYGDTPGLQATPLQVACLVSAIANGGKRYRPHLEGPPALLGELPWPRGLSLVRQGMRQAVLSGTARALDFSDRAVFAKTGTATQLHDTSLRHGWCVAFDPQVALVVFVRTGTGYEAAVPIARRILEAAP